MKTTSSNKISQNKFCLNPENALNETLLSREDKDLMIEALYAFSVLQSLSFHLPLHPHAVQKVYEDVQKAITAHTGANTDTDVDIDIDTNTDREKGESGYERDVNAICAMNSGNNNNNSKNNSNYKDKSKHIRAAILSMRDMPSYITKCEHYADVANEYMFRVEMYMSRTTSDKVLTPPLSSYTVYSLHPISSPKKLNTSIAIDDIDNDTSCCQTKNDNEISNMTFNDNCDDIYRNCDNHDNDDDDDIYRHCDDGGGNNGDDSKNSGCNDDNSSIGNIASHHNNSSYEITKNDEKKTNNEDDNSNNDDDDDDDAFQYIKTMQITPSNIVCKPANYMKTSRLIRAVSKQYHLVYVHLRDEGGESIYNHDIYDLRYKRYFENGICGPWVQNLELQFLMCSGSQMRQQSAIFLIGTKDDVLHVRNLLLPDEAKLSLSVCKYLSGLGLFCTADHPIVDLSLIENSDIEHPLLLPDTYTKDGCKLTDGAAVISMEFMKELIVSWPNLFPNSDCTAFQVRYRGYKGVISVSPDVYGRIIKFRESNVKFKSPHSFLCIVKTADYNKLNVNRDVLNLLSCLGAEGVAGGDWNPLPSLIKMQENELSRLANSLINHADAKRILKVHLNGMSNLLDKYSDINVDFTIEPFFRLCVLQVYEHAVRHLRTKTHIPIHLGALLMGIPDPYNVLGEGEIFFQIRKPGSDSTERITGNVLMYRNPCLHPGDVRVVTAIDCSVLSKYVNVLLFPANNSMKRSLSAECSGGDLDGDHFALIWDKNLIPPVHRITPPMDYQLFADTCKKKQEEKEEASGEKIEQTEIGYMMAGMRTSLGKVARLHLAVCDILPKGALDPLSIRIAEQASVAVDFPKTGVAASLPKEGAVLLRCVVLCRVVSCGVVLRCL